MSTVYRQARNIERSILDYTQEQINLAFTGVTVLKGGARVYESKYSMPIIVVNVTDNSHNPGEIGSISTRRDTLLIITIHTNNSGLSMDIADYLVGKFKQGSIYYKYTIENGSISSKIADGRIQFKNLRDTPVDLNIDKATLDEKDKHRHQITSGVRTNKLEL